MGIIQLLSKLQNFVGQKGNVTFSMPAENQQAYIARFPEPKDDFQRSYFQYRAQAMMRGRLTNSLVSVISLPVTVLMILKYRCSSVPEKESFCENRAVFFRDGKPANIMPNVLLEEFAQCITDPEEGNHLHKEDIMFIWQVIRRYPLSWQMILKCVIKIARYRYALEKYAPKALVVCNEYSFTSSVLTQFCERNGVELINVMHGEKLYYIRDSFFRFHRCYVWDEYYAQLFTKQRAKPDRYIAIYPNSMVFNFPRPETPEYDYTYYFQNETEEELKRLCVALLRLREKGAKIALRPHPRYSNAELLASLFSGMDLEDCDKITIEQSILRSRNAISGYSTVLQQAYYNGVSVVIDDITNPERHAKLEEYGYIMLNVGHKLLSDEVKKYDAK